ncbi:DMT family transporter [Dendrosporobacter sp. 1207_IL3150]|uniref:DMT family transporter n=1 Tax=Dendrosporobacter sp. 1207_IL3150 TaxID=3084054 RepID=UPI002FDB29D6
MSVHIILAFVAFLWGINPPIMKIGLLYIEPMPYNAIRMVLALTAGWIVLRRLGCWQPVIREFWKPLIVSSLGFFLFQIFFTLGVQNTTAGNSSLILGCLPISVAIINHYHGLESINRKMLVSICISLFGVVIMIAGTDKEFSFSGTHVFGALMLLIAQMSYGYYTVFSRHLTSTYSAYQVTAYILLISTGLFILISIPSIMNVDWSTIPWPGWASILYSGLFPLCLGNCLWIWGTGILGSTKASLYNNLPPVFAVITGYIFLSESFGILQFIGASTIFAGLYLAKSSKTASQHDKLNDV